MPVILEGRRALLEDLAAALGTKDVVSEAEVFVEEERGLGDPLGAVLALYLVGSVCGLWFCISVCWRCSFRVEHGDLEAERFGNARR
jgi:hypothetical protein